MDQPGTIDINPANRENENIPVSVRAREFDLARRGSAVPSCVSLLILHTKAESGAYSRDSSRFPRRHPLFKPSYEIESVLTLSGHAIAYP